MLEEILTDPELTHVNFDISWDEVAKYIVATPEASRSTAALIEKYPDRFLVGTDNVALTDPKAVFVVFNQYQPLWDALSPQAGEALRKGHFARLFDTAAEKVRRWDKANPAPL